ncbi:MAG: phage major tail tube protein [Brasilonema octagenarum HA4186-MV1]|jgi:phage tail tube protein FII|nr:phage major tail tube protein [Brasilonema octagenarum HA4186-MV1]
MPLPIEYKIKGQWAVSMVGGGATPATFTGAASEFTIDGLEREADDDRRPGAAGAISYQGDFNAMKATIKLMGITDALRDACMESVCSNVTFTLSAVAENKRDACDIATFAATLRGIILKYPIGWQFKNETAENEIVLGVNYYQDVWKGKTFEYDPDNMLWNWKGTNLWAARKTALGM